MSDYIYSDQLLLSFITRLMPRGVETLFGGASSDDEDAFFAGDSDGSRSDSDNESVSESEFSASDASPWPSSSAASVVNLTSSPPAAAAASASAGAVQTVADDDDDDIQILTEAEAAAEVAAAARRLLEDPSAASRKRKRPLVETKAEPTECTICCEDCTIVGRHRLVALRCGHLFGKKCIERWINEKRTCPNCSAPLRRTDICPLFSDHVAVVDNSGLEDMTVKYEEEKKKSTRLETEVATLKKLLDAKTKESITMKQSLANYRHGVANMQTRLDRYDRAYAASQAKRGGQAVATSANGVTMTPQLTK